MERCLPLSGEKPPRFAALACHLNDAQSAYRGPTGGPLLFLTYGTVTLSQIPK